MRIQVSNSNEYQANIFSSLLSYKRLKGFHYFFTLSSTGACLIGRNNLLISPVVPITGTDIVVDAGLSLKEIG